MHPFPSIEQFRSVVREAHKRGLTKVVYVGTVKVHGTNAAIVRAVDGSITCQSRSRVITPDADNMGFAAFVAEMSRASIDYLFLQYPKDKVVALYGEWAGRGIQSGVAVSQVDRFFYPFAARNLTDETWLPLPQCRTPRVFPAMAVGLVGFDFTNPVSLATAQQTLVIFTEAVEAECPVGKALGVSGVGEGVVWRCVGEPSSTLWFKVKGEKHSVSKVKTLVPIDVERVASVQAFVDKVCTTNRLRQGLDVLREQSVEINTRAMGDFIRWVMGDVLKEEADTMAASGITTKEIGAEVGRRAREFLLANL